MQTTTLDVQGMSCGACVGHVTRALQGLDGVQSAQVSLQDKQAVVTYDSAKVQVAQMAEAVADEGYEASPRA
jgi:copper chaperone